MAAYVDYEFYKLLYGDDAVPESDFNRLSWEACRKLDSITSGKLKFAFPTDEDDAETVRRCACKLIEIAAAIEAANKRVAEGQGYVVDEATGSVRGKAVASVTSGSESISYTAKSDSGSTIIDSVLSDKDAQEKLFLDTAKDYLYGARDANGVPLLYAGMPYPGGRSRWV